MLIWKSGRVRSVNSEKSAAGSSIDSGTNPEIDPQWVEVAKYLKIAAEGGHLKAIYNYGVCFQRGTFFFYDKGRSFNFFSYKKGRIFLIFSGRGTPQDFQQAFFWFKKGAEHGDSDCLNNLGQCLSLGTGCQKDERAAFSAFVKYVKKSSEKNRKSLLSRDSRNLKERRRRRMRSRREETRM